MKFKYYNGEGGEERSEQEKACVARAEPLRQQRGRLLGLGCQGSAVGGDGGWFYYNEASGFFWFKNPDWPNTREDPWYPCYELYPFISFERVS